MDFLIKPEVLTKLNVTGTSNSHALADSCTVQSLQNNDTCYWLPYREVENYTYMAMNFHTLVDAILSIPLNAISIVGSPSIYIDKPLFHINNNAMVTFLNTHSYNIKIKFKDMALQYCLPNIFAFPTLCIYISVKLLVVMAFALKSIKQKLQNQCCTLLHLNKSICGNNIYYLKNPTNFCNMNQHLSTCPLCKHQQQVVTIDLTNHRHFSDIWCITCQENLFGS